MNLDRIGLDRVELWSDNSPFFLVVVVVVVVLGKELVFRFTSSRTASAHLISHSCMFDISQVAKYQAATRLAALDKTNADYLKTVAKEVCSVHLPSLFLHLFVCLPLNV